MESGEGSDEDWSPDSPLSTEERASIIVERIRGEQLIVEQSIASIWEGSSFPE